VPLGWVFARNAAQVTYIPQDIVQDIGEGFVSIKCAPFTRNAVPFDTLTSVFRAVHRRAFVVSLRLVVRTEAAPLAYIPHDIVHRDIVDNCQLLFRICLEFIWINIGSSWEHTGLSLFIDPPRRVAV
jgi:hypothetical protein